MDTELNTTENEQEQDQSTDEIEETGDVEDTENVEGLETDDEQETEEQETEEFGLDEFGGLSDDEEEEDEKDEEPDVEESVEEAPSEEVDETVEEPEPIVSPAMDVEDPNSAIRKQVIEVTNAAKEEVEALYGVEYDEFNAEHQAAFSMFVGQQTNKRKAYRSAQSEAIKIMESVGSDKFQADWQRYMGDMRHADCQAMLDAEARGDYSLSLKHMKQCAAKKKATMTNARNKAGGSKSKKRKPPHSISSGNGSSPRRKDSRVFSLEDLGL